MSFVDDLKVYLFFGVLVAIVIAGIGHKLFGWGIKPGQENRQIPPVQSPQQKQQYYQQQQQQIRR